MNKKNSMRRSICSILSLCVMLSLNTVNVSAHEEINDKQRFMNSIEASMMTAENNINISQGNVEDVLLKYAANDLVGALEIINSESLVVTTNEQNATSNYELIENYLNVNGVYIYSSEIIPTATYSVGSRDINMSVVTIAYNSYNNTWVVTGGGSWRNTNYLDDAPAPSVYTGAKPVGGMDAVGFALMDTSGEIPALQSCSGYIHDGNGRSINLYNPYNSNSRYGIVFQYQDEVYFSEDLTETCYMGYGFAAQGIYSSNFANYNGRARSYYAHTWDRCSINSIGITSDGISAGWSNSSYGWEIYNNSDKVF